MITINIREDKVKSLTTTSIASKTNGECDLSEYFVFDRAYPWEYGSNIIGAITKDDLKSNLKFTDKESFSKVYVSKSCNIPTITLQNSGITRKRKIEDAEVSVIPDLSYNSVEFDVDIWYDGNTYYIVKHRLNQYYRTKEFKERTEVYCCDLINDNGELLKSLELLPENAVKIFKGAPVKFDKKLQAFLDEFSRYKEVIFDSDFNKIISKEQEDITEENIEYIRSLIFSDQVSNRDIGLNLLFSLNIRPYAFKVAQMLGNNKWRLENTPFYKSTKMDRLLQNIGLTKSCIGCEERILNKTFEYNCQSEKDRIRQMLADRAICEATRYLKSLNRYHFFNGYKFNDVIVLHGEKSYSYTGKQR